MASFESLSKQGSFSKDFLEKLSQDQVSIEKLAAAPGMGTALKGMLPTLGIALGASALTGVYGYLQAKKKYEERAEDLSNSYQTLLLTHKGFSKNPEDFRQRFGELSLISPTVASNPRLAQKIIEPRLTKGFDLDDVHRLSAIEHHTASTPKVPTPLTGGAEAAGSMLNRAWSNVLFPMAVTRLVTQQAVEPIGKEVHTIAKRVQPVTPEKPSYAMRPKEEMEAMRKQLEAMGLKPGSLLKKESSGGAMPEMKLHVSEECLARMLADRYSMMKTAGILPQAVTRAAGQAGKYLAPSAKATGKYLQMMAIPLVIGGGIQLVNQLMKAKESKETGSKADQVFAQLRKSNQNVQENLPVAQEAFDTLKSFAPALAAKPLVARTFIEHVISSEGRIPPDTAQMLANTQKMIGQLNEATGGGFIEGLKSPMGLFKHKVGGSKEE